MKLTIKTLKGEKFDVQVEEGNTVAEVKGIIVSLNLEANVMSHLSIFGSDRILN
jgi:hypothetical protein